MKIVTHSNHQQAVKTMESYLSREAIYQPKGPIPVPEGMTKEEFIKSLQCNSTKMIMDRPIEKDKEWQNRPLPKEAIEQSQRLEKALSDGDSAEFKRLVGNRELSPDEIFYFESMRRRSKNTKGQSEAKGHSDQKRENAVQGFIYTPPAKVTTQEVTQRAVGLVEYKSEPLIEEVKKITWFDAIKDMFKPKESKDDRTLGERWNINGK